VPYENYRKIFRTSQKNVERELGAVLSTSKDLSSRASSGSVDQEAALKSVDGMIGRVENLKRKVHSMTPPGSTLSLLGIIAVGFTRYGW
jgi:macrophage erythroblast attacher